MFAKSKEVRTRWSDLLRKAMAQKRAVLPMVMMMSLFISLFPTLILLFDLPLAIPYSLLA
jgi:hypothetical protein